MTKVPPPQGFSDERHGDVVVVRPMREHTLKEVAFYNRLFAVPSVFTPAVDTKVSRGPAAGGQLRRGVRGVGTPRRPELLGAQSCPRRGRPTGALAEGDWQGGCRSSCVQGRAASDAGELWPTPAPTRRSGG